MKNVYELNSKERKKYRKEFNKIRMVKNLSVARYITLIIMISFLILSPVICKIADHFNQNALAMVECMDLIAVIAFVVLLLMTVAIEVIFVRWLKIKHKIEY